MTRAGSFFDAVLINHQDPATLAGSLCGFITLTRGTYAWSMRSLGMCRANY